MARAVERALGEAAAALAATRKRLKPGLDADARTLGDGLAVTSGAGSSTNTSRVWGLGLTGPVDDDTLDAVEAFFTRPQPAVVVVTPLADRALLPALLARGFTIAGFESVLGAELATLPPFIVSTPFGVRVLETEEHDAVTRVVRATLGDDEAARAALTVAPLLHAPCTLRAAFDGASPIGVGALAPVGDVGVLLAGMTIPSHRRHGVQRALIAARIDAARRAGLRLVVSVARPGSRSERNLIRAGLRVLYTALVLEKR